MSKIAVEDVIAGRSARPGILQRLSRAGLIQIIDTGVALAAAYDFVMLCLCGASIVVHRVVVFAVTVHVWSPPYK